MLVARLFQIVALPPIGNDDTSRHDGSLYEIAERIGGTVSHAKPNSASIAAASPLMGPFPAPADLDGANHGYLPMDAAPSAAGAPTDKSLVYLDVFPGAASDSVLIWTHHACPQLVENLEGRLIAGDTKLTLKLPGRHAGRLAGDQIGGPKPCDQPGMTPFHYRPHRHTALLAAFAAAENTWAGRDANRLSSPATTRTDKAFLPATPLKISRASVVVREQALELGK
jgi:hypothetical protein